MCRAMERMKSSKRRQLGDDVFRNWMSDPRVRAARRYSLREELQAASFSDERCFVPTHTAALLHSDTKRAAATLRIVMLAS